MDGGEGDVLICDVGVGAEMCELYELAGWEGREGMNGRKVVSRLVEGDCWIACDITPSL